MITKTMFKDTSLEKEEIFGNLYFWDKLHPNSLYISTNFHIILEDCDFASLLHFLNKDISELNNMIIKFISTTPEDMLNESENTDNIIKIVDELASWHPYFGYHGYIHLCDIIANYFAKIIIYSNEEYLNSNTSEDIPFVTSNTYFFTNIKNIFKNYLTKENIYAITSYYESIIKMSQQSNYIDYRYLNYISEIPFHPLDEYEELRTYIIKNIPQCRPDRNTLKWSNFISAFCQEYGSIDRLYRQSYYSSSTISQKITDIVKPEVLERALEKFSNHNKLSKKESHYVPLSENDKLFDLLGNPIYKNTDEYVHSTKSFDYYKYTPESFSQYLLAQLIQLSETDCVIKFCSKCLQCYLQKPNTEHTHSEYINEMLNLKTESYKKIYSQYYNHSSGLTSLHEYDLYQFHIQTYKTAIDQNISPSKYKAYIDQENYTHIHFKSLPPLNNFDE